jgi:hypothetical protein
MRLSELIEQARQWYDVQPGQCVEVHTGPAGEIAFQQVTTPEKFVAEWGYVDAMGRSTWPADFGPAAWLGVVHQEGACLINLTASAEQLTDG